MISRGTADIVMRLHSINEMILSGRVDLCVANMSRHMVVVGFEKVCDALWSNCIIDIYF